MVFSFKHDIVLSPSSTQCFSDTKAVIGMIDSLNRMRLHYRTTPNMYIVKEDKTIETISVLDSTEDVIKRFDSTIYAHSLVKSEYTYMITSENMKLKNYCFCCFFERSEFNKTSLCYGFVHRKILGEVFGSDGLYEL